MAAASSELAPSVSSKSLRAELLNDVAIIPDDQVEEMAISKPQGQRCERCSHNPETLHSQYGSINLCENKLNVMTICVLLSPVLVLLAAMFTSSSG